MSSTSSKYSLVSGSSSQSAATLLELVARVEGVRDRLGTPRMRQLQLIRGSPEVRGEVVLVAILVALFIYLYCLPLPLGHRHILPKILLNLFVTL